jgi:hypothetical protein
MKANTIFKSVFIAVAIALCSSAAIYAQNSAKQAAKAQTAEGAPATGAATAAATDATATTAAPELITRVYPVADLVFTPPDYPYKGLQEFKGSTKFGGMSAQSPVGPGMGGGGFGGGGAAPVGGFGGGGFNVKPETGKAAAPAHGGGVTANDFFPQTPLDELIDAITTSIDTNSWAQNGGPGTISPFGSRLIVTQTKGNHSEIANLLAALRADGYAHGTVTVRVWWLRLDKSQYQALVAGTPSQSPPLVNRTQLDALANQSGADFGQITCFDGQTVHMISGRFRNTMAGVIPVVGDNAATYEPTIEKQHSGALLEITPTRLPESRSIVLDVRSIMNRPDDRADEPIKFRDIATLDRLNSISQQLATTLKVPVRQPVLVGGLSLQPGAAAEADSKTQLYLIVEATDESGAK